MTKQRLKTLLFCCALAGAFGLGFSQPAQAILGRGSGQGYFLGAWDTAGDYVLRPYTSPGPTASGCGGDGTYAIPYWVDSKQEFINFIWCKLNSNATYHVQREDRTGAAFIIQSMRAAYGPSACEGGSGNNCRPSDATWNDWVARINNPAVSVNWNACVSWSINSLYQGNPVASNSSPNDDTFYNSSGSSCQSIVFSWSGGSYSIRRFCANPVTWGEIPPLPSPWSAVGYSTVSDSNDSNVNNNIYTTPGETLTFRHYIRNDGPSSANIWYHLTGRNGANNTWTARYYNNTSLSGTPVLTRNEDIINYRDTVGNQPPGPGVVADGFSARWTKTQSFTAGDYWFTMKTDDGARLYIDGTLILDAWVPQGATPYSASRTLSAGNHTITLEYFESGGPGWATLDYINYYVVGGTDSGWYSPGQTKLIQTETYTVPSNATANSQYCRRILWDWKNSSGAGDWGLGTAGWADMVCAIVTVPYNLNPSVVVSAANAQVGDTVQFTYRVHNNSTATSPSATCTARDGSGNTVTVSGMTCASGQVFPPAASPLVVGTENFTIPVTATPGSTICRTLTIAPAGTTTASRTSSPPTCVIVAKVPHVRFGGNDVWAGGGFSAVTPLCNTNARITTVGKALSGTTPTQYAGSSVEYNAFALDRVLGFGSAGHALVNSGSLGQVGRSMTFGNNEADVTQLGYFGAAQHCIEDYSSRYSVLPGTAPGSTPGITSASSGAWRVTGNLTLSRAMPAGNTKVYYVQGNVTIGNNITYPASYSGIASIPSLLIVATGQIRVQEGVTRMDGQYVSRGTFFTCYPKVEPATVSACNNPLTVNGSVMANTLDLFRNYGADGLTTTTRREPAELFDFSPELYLRNLLNTSGPGGSTVEATNILELPPRF